MLHERYNSIDIVKGIIILLILITNIISLSSMPLWHDGMKTDSITSYLSAILFPALLFMFGMTIPFSITKKINNGMSGYDISKGIFARSVVLITVGVLMVNASRVDPELTGFSKHIWALLLYISVFLVWNRYPEKENNFFTTTGLRLAGLAVLVFLVFRFRSGTFENNGSLIPGWWELPGLAGWGYLAAAFTYLAFRNSVPGTSAVLFVFIGLNVLRNLGLSGFLDGIMPYFGVILDGFIPSIVISGLLAGIMIKKSSVSELKKPAIAMTTITLIALAAGILLRRFFFPEGHYGNPSIMLISTGTAGLFFVVVFWIYEIAGFMKSISFLRKTGANMFSAYTIQYLLLNLIWLSGINLLFFVSSENRLITIACSVIWALIVMAICNLLAGLGIRLKF